MRSPAPTNLPAITWAGQRVITTKLLARQYGTTSVRIRQNHTKKAGRFIEGKHYFKLVGVDLREFKDRVALGDSVTSRARSVVLWTKRGAARHAKMLETEQAWDVFETLEEAYFEREALRETLARPSTVREREPILVDSVLIMTRHRISLPYVYRGISHFAGVERFRDMTPDQVDEAHAFGMRLLRGQDTGSDWRRLQCNRDRLNAGQRSLDLAPTLFLGEVGHA